MAFRWWSSSQRCASDAPGLAFYDRKVSSYVTATNCTPSLSMFSVSTVVFLLSPARLTRHLSLTEHRYSLDSNAQTEHAPTCTMRVYIK